MNIYRIGPPNLTRGNTMANHHNVNEQLTQQQQHKTHANQYRFECRCNRSVQPRMWCLCILWLPTTNLLLIFLSLWLNSCACVCVDDWCQCDVVHDRMLWCLYCSLVSCVCLICVVIWCECICWNLFCCVVVHGEWAHPSSHHHRTRTLFPMLCAHCLCCTYLPCFPSNVSTTVCVYTNCHLCMPSSPGVLSWHLWLTLTIQTCVWCARAQINALAVCVVGVDLWVVLLIVVGMFDAVVDLID